MTVVARAIAAFAERIAGSTARLSQQVAIDPLRILDRSDVLDLRPPGRISPNRSCRLVRAADGWLAVNLPRPDDREMLPAWIGCAPGSDPWPAVIRRCRGRSVAMLLEQAVLLGLAVSAVGEVAAASPYPPVLPLGVPRIYVGGDRRPFVVDLSSLWAGPLCGATLAAAGATVTKVESATRPDSVRTATPALDRSLNGQKARLMLDFADPGARARLAEMVEAADVVITSARPRAFPPLGLAPAAVFRRNPAMIWVAVTGYGWEGAAGDRAAFGDDAAAAGGLVRRTANGAPRFLGDALADPLTGLVAAIGTLDALEAGGGVLIDAALARTAAGCVACFGDPPPGARASHR